MKTVLNKQTENPAESLLYILNPLDNKYYDVYDWAWMIDGSPTNIKRYALSAETHDDVFDNKGQSPLAEKFRNYLKFEPIFRKFCYNP